MRISLALPHLLGVCAAVLAACGGAGPSTGTSSAGSSSASSGSAGTESATSGGTTGSASSAASSGAASSSGDGTSTSAGSSAGTAGSTGSGSSGTTSSGSSSGGSSAGSSGGSSGGAGATYFAFALVGGLDRVIVRHADNGLCTELRLVYPGNLGSLPISAPAGWSVEGASIHDGLADCLTTNPLATTAVEATGGSGSVAWPAMMQLYPCLLDVDATLDFAMPPVWAPGSTALFATDLPVSGC